MEPGGHLERRAPPGSGPAPAPPLCLQAPPPPTRSSGLNSICIRRRFPVPPGVHVTPGRRREPADLTRAVLRLPLARNSKSSRDLRPRPPAANKSAGRLQTQNFHVGKSQDGRERSGAPTGSWSQRPGMRRAGLRRAGALWEGGQARQAEATPGLSSGALWTWLCRPRSPVGQDGDCAPRTCCTRATAACAQCVGRRAGLRTVVRGGWAG